MLLLPLKVREMMNRYLALAILLLFSTLYHFFVDDYLQVSVHHESSILNNQVLDDDSYPIQNDDPHKIINFTLISLVLIILFITKSSTFLTNISRKQIFLNPIFYQSNFVIVSPLCKKIYIFNVKEDH